MMTIPNPTNSNQPMPDRYLEPGWFTRNVFNRLVRRLTLLGVSIRGSRELRVKGRTSGEWRSTPVNLLVIDGVQYLVAPRGITQWVRNMRVAASGELRVGRRVEPFRAVEMADADKPRILREYLRLWKSEVGVFFNGVSADATDEDLLAIANGYPVFVIEPLAA
jgi:F420H(2)-dependent quinone reductase